MAGSADEEFQRSALKKGLICARGVLRNLRTFARTSMGAVGGDSGSTHLNSSVEDSVEYIRRVYEDYFRYGSEHEDGLAGKRILEIGPGDSVGLALLLAAAGAEQVVGVDAFDSVRDEAYHRQVVRALRATVPPAARPRFDEACDPDSGRLNPDRVLSVTGVRLEEAESKLGRESFDWIVSRAVLEETRNAGESMRVIDRLLRPGGAMTHKIDLRDYGLFSGRGFHPLESYTIPAWIYPWMSNHSWIPNRAPLSAYRNALEDLGYEVGIHYTHLTGVEQELIPHPAQLPEGPQLDRARQLAADIRPRLANGFRGLPDEDLVVAGVFLNAKKPDAGC